MTELHYRLKALTQDKGTILFFIHLQLMSIDECESQPPSQTKIKNLKIIFYFIIHKIKDKKGSIPTVTYTGRNKLRCPHCKMRMEKGTKYVK